MLKSGRGFSLPRDKKAYRPMQFQPYGRFDLECDIF